MGEAYTSRSFATLFSLRKKTKKTWLPFGEIVFLECFTGQRPVTQWGCAAALGLPNSWCISQRTFLSYRSPNSILAETSKRFWKWPRKKNLSITTLEKENHLPLREKWEVLSCFQRCIHPPEDKHIHSLKINGWNRNFPFQYGPFCD